MEGMLIIVVIGICIIGVIIIASRNEKDKSPWNGMYYGNEYHGHDGGSIGAGGYKQSQSDGGHWGGREGSHSNYDGGNDGGGDGGGE